MTSRAGNRKNRRGEPRAGRSTGKAALPAEIPWEILLKGAAGLMLVATAFLTLRGPTLSFLQQDPPNPWIFIPTCLAGVVLLFLFFRDLPEVFHHKEMSRATAWSFLAVILMGAAFLRLAKWGDPPAMYWQDYALSIIDSRAILELGQHHLLFAAGDRPPLYQYFISFICMILPGASSVTMQNVAFALMDLIGLWVLYLLGKEAGGRRTGLILVAWAAVTKPRMVLCMTQQACLTGAPAVEAALLFTLRLWKRPDRKRFLEWGVVLALAVYCYQSARPFLGFLPMAVLAGLWLRSDRRPRSIPEKTLALALAAVWTGLFLSVNRFLPPLPVLHGRWVPAALFGLVAGLYLIARLTGRSRPGAKPLFHWVEGLILAAVLMYPIASQSRFAAHTTDLSSLHAGGQLRLNAQVLSVLWGQFINTLSTFFLSGWDHPYMSIPGETFFEFHSLPLLALGLAYLAARPEGLKGFLFLCALVGMSPHVLSGDPHTGKLQGAVGPLLLLGSLAVDRALSELEVSRKRRWIRIGTAVLSVYLLSAGALMYHRFYVWLIPKASPDRVIWQLAKEDRAAGRRLFLHSSEFFFYHGATSAVPCEDMEMGFIRSRFRFLWLEPDRAVPDVVIYVNGQEEEFLRRLHREYPGAAFEGVRVYPQNPTDKPALQRILIPGRLIPESAVGTAPSKCIEVRRVPGYYWRRKVYAGGAGLGRGLVEYEDAVADPHVLTADPGGSPGALNRGGFSGVLDGTLAAPSPGRYAFWSHSANYAILDLDGRRVLDVRPRKGPQNARAEVELEAGEHKVRLMTYFREGQKWPQVQVVFPDGTEKPLGFRPSPGND